MTNEEMARHLLLQHKLREQGYLQDDGSHAVSFDAPTRADEYPGFSPEAAAPIDAPTRPQSYPGFAPQEYYRDFVPEVEQLFAPPQTGKATP